MDGAPTGGSPALLFVNPRGSGSVLGGCCGAGRRGSIRGATVMPGVTCGCVLVITGRAGSIGGEGAATGSSGVTSPSWNSGSQSEIDGFGGSSVVIGHDLASDIVVVYE